MSKEKDDTFDEKPSNSTGAKASTSKAGLGLPGRRRHSRLSFLPRVASEVVDNTSLSTSVKDSTGKGDYRLVIMGSAATGKTAIIKRFLYDTFPEEHHPTVEELHKSEYEIKGVGLVSVEILDTSGTFSFPAMKRLAINSGSAFVLVYAINDKESFDEVTSLREMINLAKSSENSETTVPIVIAGNKIDLTEERIIDREMVEFECIDWEVGFVECSARSNENVVQIFQQLLLQAHLKGSLTIIPGSGNHQNPHNSHFHHHHAWFSHLTSHHHHNNSSENTASNITTTRNNIEPNRKDHSRRRSSLPVADLFNYSMSLGSPKSSRSPSKKRKSCTPS